MAISIKCPSCRHRLKLPERLAGRHVKCPACGDFLDIPAADETDGLPLGPPPPAITYPADVATPADRLGMAAVAMGLASVLVLCIPVLGYAAIAVSGVGLLLGLWALIRSGFRIMRRPQDPVPDNAIVRSNPLANPILSYPFLGTLVCLVVLVLLILPLVLEHSNPS